MGEQHDHTHGANKKVLVISFTIITLYMLVEVFGGLWTNSLALLSDAGHMLSDAISLAIALIAFNLSERAATATKTYGYKRFEIIAAVVNGVTLIIIALFIFYEAVQRFANPPAVATTGMLIISSIGLLVNILVAFIMMRGADTKENLNMRGAFLHVISDMLGSVGAIIAALCIMLFGWGFADPLASIIVAVLVLRSGYYVTKASVHVLMEGTPTNVDTDKILQVITETDGVEGIHDLHLWTITSGLNALSCHIVVASTMTIVESQALLHKLEHKLADHNIQHSTIQVETIAHTHTNAVTCAIEGQQMNHHHHH